MHAFEGASRPVLFEHSGEEYPYWGKGSSVLLATLSNYYWVTARHVVDKMGGTTESLRIFPADESRISLPFNEQYTIRIEGSDDEDYKDLFVLRIDLTEFERTGDEPLTAQDVVHGWKPAKYLLSGSELWIIGYPAESNNIDFETRTIKNTRSVIRATYKGNSELAHCHVAQIDTSIILSSFDGLSGSPVYYLAQIGNVQFPILVGILLRGTAESSLVHFLDAQVIIDLIRLAENDV